MAEIWKEITGYEGLYQVSNLGNVRRIARVLRADIYDVFPEAWKVGQDELFTEVSILRKSAKD